MAKLTALWQGRLPLGEAFWTWALAVGLLVNLVTSALFLGLVSAEQPWLALLCGYGLSLPYNLAAVVGVWRSAARHDGSPLHEELARWTTTVLMIVLSVT